jgi:hypothetical protein
MRYLMNRLAVGFFLFLGVGFTAYARADAVEQLRTELFGDKAGTGVSAHSGYIAFTGLPSVPNETTVQYLQDLLSDAVVAASVNKWAAEEGIKSGSQLSNMWAFNYADTMAKGLPLLSNADIAVLSDEIAYNAYGKAMCTGLPDGTLNALEELRIRTYVSNMPRYLAILKKAYVLALASRGPEITVNETAYPVAMEKIMRNMDSNVVNAMENANTSSGKTQLCRLNAARWLVLSAPGAEGNIVRRHELPDNFRAKISMSSGVAPPPRGYECSAKDGALFNEQFAALLKRLGVKGQLRFRARLRPDSVIDSVSVIRYAGLRMNMKAPDGKTTTEYVTSATLPPLNTEIDNLLQATVQCTSHRNDPVSIEYGAKSADAQ